jgi:hypothetical protein
VIEEVRRSDQSKANVLYRGSGLAFRSLRVALILVTAAATSDAIAADGRTDLAAPVAPRHAYSSGIKLEAHQFGGFGAYNAVAEIAAHAHVVIGFVAVRPKEWSAYDFHFSGGTLADLLDSFVNQNPDYQWEVIEDGVFRVRRRGEPVSLAAEAVSYPGAVDATRKEIWEGIQGLPEVKAWMISNHCSPLDLLSGNEFRIHNEPINIEPQSLSVSQLLDKVALRSGSERGGSGLDVPRVGGRDGQAYGHKQNERYGS